MNERTKGRAVARPGMSDEFEVNVGLRQGSALSPLLFIMVMELISKKAGRTARWMFSGRSCSTSG